MSNSSTGGYVKPGITQPIPNRLTLVQFIQTVLVGISALPGPSVRPKWQTEPPKQLDLEANWIAFGIAVSTPDANSFVGLNSANKTISQRHEGLEIACSIYGPDAQEISGLIRDGFQIQQNLEALRAANMGFTEVGRSMHIPDLVNERFINRIEMSIFLRREVQREYPILPILSATGSVHTVFGTEQYLFAWRAGP